MGLLSSWGLSGILGLGVSRSFRVVPVLVSMFPLGSLSGNSYFSALDAASGYWQVPMASVEDREKAAFRTFCGHYQPTRMAFGLVNGPAQFQRMMDTAL